MSQKNIQTQGDSYYHACLVYAARLNLKKNAGVTNEELRHLGLSPKRNKGWRRAARYRCNIF